MLTRDAATMYLDDCTARQLSARTIKGYAHVLARLAEISPELPTGPAPLRALLASVNATPETVHGYYRVVRAFFNFLELDGLIDTTPVRQVKPPRRRPKRQRYLTANEIQRLLILDMSDRDRALIRLLLDTGIRIGEAVTLTPTDLRVDTILVRGKTGERLVPISAEVLRAVLNVSGPDWVFPGRTTHLTTQRAYKIVRRALQAIGIAGHRIGPHTLRHTFGYQWVNSGGDVFALQKIMGHATLEMTRRYVDLNTTDAITSHRLHATWARDTATQLELRLVK